MNSGLGTFPLLILRLVSNVNKNAFKHKFIFYFIMFFIFVLLSPGFHNKNFDKRIKVHPSFPLSWKLYNHERFFIFNCKKSFFSSYHCLKFLYWHVNNTCNRNVFWLLLLQILVDKILFIVSVEILSSPPLRVENAFPMLCYLIFSFFDPDICILYFSFILMIK